MGELLKLPAIGCEGSPIVKKDFYFYSLANPVASTGVSARCSIHCSMEIRR